MAPQCYKTSAPGSLILMGEYAVLQGHPCLVLAIDQTLSVCITPNQSKQIHIESALGNHVTSIDHIEIQAPLEYVLTTLKAKPLPSGAHLKITSELAATKGLGSSAAVTVALLQALNAWNKQTVSKEELFLDALDIIHQVQGKGSGADIAASIYGGAQRFTTNPFTISPLFSRPDITVVYSGHKTTTTKALQRLSKNMHTQTDFINQVFTRLGDLSAQAVNAFQQEQWPQLGKLMSQAQKELQAFGVSTDKINEIITTLEKQTTISGAKISGSGLGDCVIGLGALPNNLFGDSLLPLKISDQGVADVN